MAKGWSIPPTAFAKVIDSEVQRRVRVIAVALLNQVVLRSPVDTGRFKGSHVVSIGAPVYAVPDTPDKDGGPTVDRGLAALSGLEPYTVVYIQTNLPYAERIENGWSRLAPAGVYAVSFAGVSEAYKE